jgi:hypothetical protein
MGASERAGALRFGPPCCMSRPSKVSPLRKEGRGLGVSRKGASDPVQELRDPGVAWIISVEEPFHTRGETGR